MLTNEQATGRIVLIDVKQKQAIVTSKWTFHTGRIVSLAFSPSGKRIASAGMDESIYVWEVEKTMKNTSSKVIRPHCAPSKADGSKNAHPGGASGVSWVDGDTRLITSGADGCVRTWTVPEV